MITKETKLEEIVKIKGANEVLARLGVPCVSCPMAKMEMDILEIGKIAEIYNLDLEKILAELNKLE